MPPRLDPGPHVLESSKTHQSMQRISPTREEGERGIRDSAAVWEIVGFSKNWSHRSW